MPGKLTLEHSDSNSSAESGSSVGSDSTVSSNGSGSDGNSKNFHLPVTRTNLEPERISVMSGKMYMAHEFGLSPPSESKLLRRRHKNEFDQNLSLTGRKGNTPNKHKYYVTRFSY